MSPRSLLVRQRVGRQATSWPASHHTARLMVRELCTLMQQLMLLLLRPALERMNALSSLACSRTAWQWSRRLAAEMWVDAQLGELRCAPPPVPNTGHVRHEPHDDAIRYMACTRQVPSEPLPPKMMRAARNTRSNASPQQLAARGINKVTRNVATCRAR